MSFLPWLLSSARGRPEYAAWAGSGGRLGLADAGETGRCASCIAPPPPGRRLGRHLRGWLQRLCVPHSSTAPAPQPPALPNWSCIALHSTAGTAWFIQLRPSPCPPLPRPPARPPATRPLCRILLLLVAARFTFNALLRGPTQRLAERRGAGKGHRDGSRLLEEVYVMVANVAMLAGALFVMLYRCACVGAVWLQRMHAGA